MDGNLDRAPTDWIAHPIAIPDVVIVRVLLAAEQHFGLDQMLGAPVEQAKFVYLLPVVQGLVLP